MNEIYTCLPRVANRESCVKCFFPKKQQSGGSMVRNETMSIIILTPYTVKHAAEKAFFLQSWLQIVFPSNRYKFIKSYLNSSKVLV